MKLRNIRIKKYKLLKLYLTKYQIYKNKKLICNKILDQIELHFKKALFIIYNYHVSNKKILFVGLPYSNNKKFLRVLIKSNHSFIPKSVWLNGLIGNKKSVSNKSKISSCLNNFLKIQTNPHLIVLFNGAESMNLIFEASKLDIPIISFGNSNRSIPEISYLIAGNFIKKKLKNFYQFLLYSILKKSKNKMVSGVKKKRKRLLDNNSL